jgi:MFS family permease
VIVDGAKEATVDWLDTLETVIGAIIVLGVIAAAIFGYGSRTALWFSELRTQNRRLFWAAIALVCWTVAVGAGAWLVGLLVYVSSTAVALENPSSWSGASLVATLVAAPLTAVLAGIPWLALIGLLRLLRWQEQRAEVKEPDEEHTRAP